MRMSRAWHFIASRRQFVNHTDPASSNTGLLKSSIPKHRNTQIRDSSSVCKKPVTEHTDKGSERLTIATTKKKAPFQKRALTSLACVEID